MRLSDGKQVISASFNFEAWAVASGSATLPDEPAVGSILTFVDEDETALFTGVVTSKKYNHRDKFWEASLKDPVSAVYDGEVEYTADTVTNILTAIVTGAGTTLAGTDTTELFGTIDDPVQWVDLVQSISLATGKTVRYLPDGTYEIATPTGNTAVNPIEGQTHIDVERYANQAVVTVDADWTEAASSTPVVTVETGYGIERTITKIGEQVQSVVTDLGGGKGVEETWTWDIDGYLTQYDRKDVDELEQIDSSTTYDLTGTKLTIEETTTVVKRDNPFGSWYNYRKYEKTTESYLDDDSPIQVDEYTYWYFPEESAWHYKYWTRTNALAAVPGTVASYKMKSYEYSEVDSNFYLQKTETGEGVISKGELTKVLQVDKKSYHLSSTATDDDAITAFGTIEKSLSLFGIQTIGVLETAAENYLNHCSRCSIAEIDVVPDAFEIGDKITWTGETWTIESIDHGGDRCLLKCSRYPYASEIEDALGVDSTDAGRAILAAIEKKAVRLNNAARAQVIAQVDYETYQVHVQGEAADKTRLARVDYQQGVTYPVGKEVLIVRPTGKTGTWEIVTRRHDEPTTISAVSGDTIVETAPVVTFTGDPDAGAIAVEVEFTISTTAPVTSQTIQYNDAGEIKSFIASVDDLPEEGEYGDVYALVDATYVWTSDTWTPAEDGTTYKGSISSTGLLPTTASEGDYYKVVTSRYAWIFGAWVDIGPDSESLIYRGEVATSGDLPASPALHDVYFVADADYYHYTGSTWEVAGASWPKLTHTYYFSLDPGGEETEQEFTPQAQVGWTFRGDERRGEWVTGDTVTVGLSFATLTGAPVSGTLTTPDDFLHVVYTVSYDAEGVTGYQIDHGDTTDIMEVSQSEHESDILYGFKKSHDFSFMVAEPIDEDVRAYTPKIRLMLEGGVYGPWTDMQNAPVIITYDEEDVVAEYQFKSLTNADNNGEDMAHTINFTDLIGGWMQGFEISGKFSVASTVNQDGLSVYLYPDGSPYTSYLTTGTSFYLHGGNAGSLPDFFPEITPEYNCADYTSENGWPEELKNSLSDYYSGFCNSSYWTLSGNFGDALLEAMDTVGSLRRQTCYEKRMYVYPTPSTSGSSRFIFRYIPPELTTASSVSVGTGNDSTLTFSLSMIPQLSCWNTVRAYINGVEVPNELYTINKTSKTVMFDTAPENGDVITVSYKYVAEGSTATFSMNGIHNFDYPLNLHDDTYFQGHENDYFASAKITISTRNSGDGVSTGTGCIRFFKSIDEL